MKSSKQVDSVRVQIQLVRITLPREFLRKPHQLWTKNQAWRGCCNAVHGAGLPVIKEGHCAICQKSHQNGSVDAALALFVASSMNSGFVKSDCDHGIMTDIKLSRHPESRYKCTSAFTSMLGSALQRRHGMVTWILLGKTRQDQKWRHHETSRD